MKIVNRSVDVLDKNSISSIRLALCNEDANGNVPLGKSCNRYWQCQGGYPRLQRCPAMLVFDRRSLRCVVPPTEDCDIPTTQTPIDGENPGGQQGPLVCEKCEKHSVET